MILIAERRPSDRRHSVAPFPVIDSGRRFYREDLTGRVLLPVDWLAAMFAAWGDVSKGKRFVWQGGAVFVVCHFHYLLKASGGRMRDGGGGVGNWLGLVHGVIYN